MMPTVALDERTVAIGMARRWLLPFVKLTFPQYKAGPVEKLVARELERFVVDVEEQRSPRLILELPPRVGKSELVSRKFPGWVLGKHPDWHIGLVSYGADLAEQLSRQARRVVMSDVYAEIFTRYDTEAEWASERVEIDPSSKSVSEWSIKPTKDVPQPGGMLAVGTKGTLTGKGFEVLLVDDPIKDLEEADSVAAKNRLWNFYIGTLYDRVEPGGGIVVVQQRWAPDDLIGRLLNAQEQESDEGFDAEHTDMWRRVTLPAQAEAGIEDALGRQPGEWLPGRRTPEQWEKAKAFYVKKSPRVWAAKFQQRPYAPEGAVFRPHEWVRFEDACGEPEDCGRPDCQGHNAGPVFIFGDTSYGKGQHSDFSVFGVWRMEKETFRLLEVYRQRAPFPTLKRDLLELCVKWGIMLPENGLSWYGRSRVFIEDYGSGTSLIQEFMIPVDHPVYGRKRIPVQAWKPKRDQDKDARAHAVTPTMASGKVAFPKKADWLPHLLQTMSEFQGEGSVEFDDEVDMLSMSLILMSVQEPAKRGEMKVIPFQFVA